MKLTAYTDYAVRLLMYLAIHRGRLCTVREVSSVYGISRGHLMKIAGVLVSGGFISAVRGRSGGMRLAQDPARISLGQLVCFAEKQMSIAQCFDGSGRRCPIESACRLKIALNQALDAFVAALDVYSVADLVEDDAKLRKLLTAV